MEALGIGFVVILIGLLGWMLIDRSWIDEWMNPNNEVYSTSELPQAYIRMWAKPKLFDQNEEVDPFFEEEYEITFCDHDEIVVSDGRMWFRKCTKCPAISCAVSCEYTEPPPLSPFMTKIFKDSSLSEFEIRTEI